MQQPQNGADLVQYVAAVNWMRSAIPNYSKRVSPLSAALAKAFEGKSRRTKKTAAAVSLLHLWGPEEQAAFKDLRAAIIESMTLAFQDPDKRICDLTHASDRFYSGLVTQIDEEQLDLPMEEQALTGRLSFNISASGVVYACPVKTCIGILLFSLVDKELFRTL
jgi:hypothetical protein